MNNPIIDNRIISSKTFAVRFKSFIENTNVNNQETVNQNNQSRNMNLNKDMTKPNDYSQINRNKQY